MKAIFRKFFFVALASVALSTCAKDDGTSTPPVVAVTEFSFKPEHNAGLPAEVKGTISVPYILLETVDSIDLHSLIATFSAEGTMSVGEVAQSSGITANNFSQPVVYTATNEDGLTTSYTVIVKIVESFHVARMDIATPNRPNNKKGGFFDDSDKHEEYEPAIISVSGAINPAHNLTATVVNGGIRGRGNSSWKLMSKKSYRIKFSEKTSLFGLKPEKSWVLLANYYDPTLMMNAIAFELGHRMGSPYTNHTRYVDLYANGEYWGNYLVSEQVEVEANRVNVDKNFGCLLELDGYFDEAWQFRSNVCNLPVMIKSPKNMTPTMDANIKKWVGDLENALFSKSFPNSGYADLIDLPSLMNFLIINEVVLNGEAQKQPKSVYMHRNATGKFYMGPLWDFDWGFGFDEHSRYFLWPEAGLLFKPGYEGSDQPGAKFFCRFFDDPNFRAQYKAYWNEVKPKYIDNIYSFIDRTAAQIKDSQKRDSDLWHHKYHTSNQDFEARISDIKLWLQTRVAHIDKEINKW